MARCGLGGCTFLERDLAQLGVGVEIKRADAPAMPPSMASALQDLSLERLFVVYPGTARYSLGDRVDALPLREGIAKLVAW